MGTLHHIHVFETVHHRNDEALRRRLFADAHGADPLKARAALDTLARLYYGLRLPMVEQRVAVIPANAGIQTGGRT